MSILIKGMMMPTRCEECPIFDVEEDKCGIIGETNWIWADDETCETIHPRPSDCPLIELPPHGRLIDADDPLREIVRMEELALEDCETEKASGNQDSAECFECFANGCYQAANAIRFAPTIIEAEDE